jgi:hypothetical protein
VGFETTIPVFEREKRVHASDRAVTVNGKVYLKDVNPIVYLELAKIFIKRIMKTQPSRHVRNIPNTLRRYQTSQYSSRLLDM